MVMNKTQILAFVCVFLLLMPAGCVTETNRPASADVDVENASAHDDQVRLTVNVALKGGGHNITLRDVAVVFVAGNGSTVRTTQISALGDPPDETYDVVGFDATFSQPPREIRLRIGNVENPEKADFGVEGAQRSSEDPLRYGPFTQDEY